MILRFVGRCLLLVGMFSAYTCYGSQSVADYEHTISQSISNSPQYKYIGFQLNSRQMSPAIQLGRLLPKIDVGANLKHGYIIDGKRQAGGDIAAGGFDSGQGLLTLTQPLYDYGAYKDLESAQETAQFAQQDYRTNYQQFLYDVSYAYFNLAKAIKNVEYNSYNLEANKRSKIGRASCRERV